MAAIPATQLTAQIVPMGDAASASAAPTEAGAQDGLAFLFADLLAQQLGTNSDGAAAVDFKGIDLKDFISKGKAADDVLDESSVENLIQLPQPIVPPSVLPTNPNPAVSVAEEGDAAPVAGVLSTGNRAAFAAVDLAEKIMAGRQLVAAEPEILADGKDVPDFSLSSGDLAEQVVRLPQSAPAPVAATPAPVAGAIAQPVSSPGWGDVLGDRVMWMAGQQQQGAELRLNPPALGPLEIKLSMTDGQATLTFSTQHLPVKEALEAATPRLREMFSESGINLGSVSVNVGTSSQQQQADAQQSQRQSGEWSGPSQAESDFSTMTTIGVTAIKSQGNGMVDYFA
jgi:flagellar hook-length control protein FliK